MRRREAVVIAALVDAVAAPEPPLPPVARTDAVRAFGVWLAYAPRPNRAALRAALAALEVAPLVRGEHRRFSRLDRLTRLRTLRRGRSRALRDALSAAAAMSYYGDAGVMRRLGHDPERRVREARERRAREAAA